MAIRVIKKDDLDAFREYLKTEEKSRGTIEKYCRDMKMVFEWLGFEEVTKEKLVEWKKALIDSGKAVTTVNSMIAALNTFLKSMKWEDLKIKSIKVQKQFFVRDDRKLSKKEYEALIKTAYAKGNDRLGLIMETMCATGIRVSETIYITRKAVENKRVEIEMKGKHRVILLPKDLCRKLLKYVKKQKIKGQIFIGKTGRSLDRRQIWAEMKALCKVAGIDSRKVFPHNLRHLFARCFYNVAKDVAGLAAVLGHSSIETTRIYLKSTEAEYHKKIARLNLVLLNTDS